MTLDELIKANAHRTIPPTAIKYLDELITKAHRKEHGLKQVSMYQFVENKMDCSFSMYDATDWYNGKLVDIIVNEHGDTWYEACNGFKYKYCEPRYDHWNYLPRGWDYSVVPTSDTGFNIEATDNWGDGIVAVKINSLRSDWTL